MPDTAKSGLTAGRGASAKMLKRLNNNRIVIIMQNKYNQILQNLTEVPVKNECLTCAALYCTILGYLTLECSNFFLESQVQI